MSKENYGILHTHSEFSVKDSAMHLSQMFDRAKELGATSIALTDHGMLAGFYDFMKLGKEYGVKPIPGIEAYYMSVGAKEDPTRQHLILMAKDMTGFHAICDANYASYQYLYKSSGGEFPRMDRKILMECFGPGAAGHGHVIATSACMQGVLAQIILSNEIYTQEAAKIHAKRDKYHPVDDELLDNLKEEDDLQHEIEALIAKREELTAASKVSTAGMNRRLKTLKAGSEEYVELSKQLEEATEAKEQAKLDLAAVKKEIAAKKRAKTEYTKSIKSMKDSAEKWSVLDDKANEILAQCKSDEELYASAKKALLDFVSIFGDGNFYVELQYHHIQREKKCMPVLAELAKECGIPVVAANDAHYASNSYQDVRARTLIAATRFNQLVDEDIEGFGELYMKSEDDLQHILREILDADTVSQALDNIRVISDACNVELESGTHYPVFVGNEPGETSAMRLRRLATEGIPKRYPGDQWTPDKEARMEHELNVIETMGYSDYLCIVQDFLAYGRSLGYDCPEEIGFTIGPGRGSAVGSIVCYLSGITDVDPMKYGLLFERFLNPERVSMPDIDSDFANEIRDKVIGYVRNKYGEKAVCNIITKTTLAGKAAIRAVGRVTDIPASIVDEMARLVPKEVDATIKDIPNLEEICNENPVKKKLIEDALLIEGTTVAYGMHAAGVIISDNDDVGKHVPLWWNTKKEKWVAQCDMGQCEHDAGLLKMDFLGLKNLDIITDTLRRIYRNYGRRIEMEEVPMEPAIFSSIFAAGNTNSVFQFESGGMKEMLRSFRPSSMEDLILLVAAYRPGPMQYIPQITAVKWGKAKPNYIAEGMEEILAPTYGSPIYQEQIMQIFNKIGGFSLGESDIIRRAMSKKKLSILTDPKTNYRGKLIDGLVAHGATQEDAEAFWEQLLDFASYAFNKSHAAAYAHVAYYTAWLKYHFPAEYMCAVMTRTEYKKLPALIADCKKMGLIIKAPDINLSQVDFCNSANSIIFGFGNIKGVGVLGNAAVEEREKNGHFSSIKDFVARILTDCPQAYNKTAMENLIKTGTFDCFCDGNRKSVLESIEALASTIRKMLKKQQDVLDKKKALEEISAKEDVSAAEIHKAERSLENAEKSYNGLHELYIQHTFIFKNEDLKSRLDAEYELLSFYVSGSPFDEYLSAARKVKERKEISEVIDMESGKVTICGMVKEKQEFHRKSDSMPFCSFSIFDDTGEITAKCFVKTYQQYGDLISNETALQITGRVVADKDVLDDGTEVDYGSYITVDSVKVLMPERTGAILVSGETLVSWLENYDTIKSYEEKDGYELFFNDLSIGQLRRATFKVSNKILTAEIPNLEISKSSHI